MIASTPVAPVGWVTVAAVRSSWGLEMMKARRAIGASVALLAAFAALTGSAQAASETTDCGGLQAALDQAHSGDTITLDEMCVGSDFALNDSATDSRSYTLALPRSTKSPESSECTR